MIGESPIVTLREATDARARFPPAAIHGGMGGTPRTAPGLIPGPEVRVTPEPSNPEAPV